MSISLTSIAFKETEGVAQQRFCAWLTRAGFTVVSDTETAQQPDLILETGALQGVKKPVELLCQVRGALRRQRVPRAPIALQSGSLDLHGERFLREGEETSLSPLQTDVLEALLNQVGRVVSREQLFREIWGETELSENRALDQLILRLRRIIEVEPSNPDHVLSVRGVGYRLVLHLESQVRAETGSAASPRQNLPYFPDAFFGRQEVLDTLVEEVSGSRRLWTLLGPGGAGKTRLSIETGHRWFREKGLSGGVWFADLTEARSVVGVLQCIASVFDIQFAPQGDEEAWQVQLGHALAHREDMALILDNCEQAMEPVRQVVKHLRVRCEALRLLVTSRERLRVKGEKTVPIGALSVEDSVGLFHARAGWDPSLLNPAEHDTVREICMTLDGQPLAIELAASRADFFGASALQERLAKPFQVLKSRSPDLPERQRSLQAALQWSWDLLQPWEQATLAQCSAFRGGFSLEAAEAVVDLSPWPESDEVEFVLEDLIDKSLMHTRLGPDPLGRVRFGMLAMTQAFAEERLAEDTHVRTTLFKRHGEYFRQFGEVSYLDALHVHGGASRKKYLICELENLHQATLRAIEEEWATPGALCCLAVMAVWRNTRRGMQLGLPERVLALNLTHNLRGRLLCSLANVQKHINAALYRAQITDNFRQALTLITEGGNRLLEAHVLTDWAAENEMWGEPEEAVEKQGQALAIYRELGNRTFEGIALGSLAIYKRPAEENLLQEAIVIHREVGNAVYEGIALNALAIRKKNRGHFEESRSDYQQALELIQKGDFPAFEAAVLDNLSHIEHALGHRTEAWSYQQRALTMHRYLGNRVSEGISLSNASNFHFGEGRQKEAIRGWLVALEIAREIGHKSTEAVILGNLGEVEYSLGDLRKAESSFTHAVRVAKGRSRLVAAFFRGGLALVYAHLGKFSEAYRLFELVENDRVVVPVGEYIKLLVKRGQIELLAGTLPAARATLEEVHNLAQTLSTSPTSDIAKTITELKLAIDDYELAQKDIPVPTGTLTLVFTDLASTTHLWATLGDDFLPILKQHDALIIRHARRNNGYVVKNDGDSFMVAFASAEDAISFATRAQQGLRDADWKPVLTEVPGHERGLNVRFGVHGGPTRHRESPVDGRMDYFGPTVNLAARITRLAQGGEVFVSAASVEASGQQSDEGWETLQPQPVKGFAEPVSLMRFPR